MSDAKDEMQEIQNEPEPSYGQKPRRRQKLMGVYPQDTGTSLAWFPMAGSI